MAKGWHNEYERHSLAGMGIKTGNYSLASKNKRTGKKTILGYNFGTKSEAERKAKERNSKYTNYVIGGRGFATKEEAEKWKENALKNPPLNQSREEYEKVLQIEHKPAETELVVVKEKVSKPNITPKPKGFEIWDVEDPDGAGMNKEQYLQMWQHLVDTGQAWSLQGWYGRTAQALLDAGEIKYPKKKTYDYYGNPIRTR